MIERFIKNELTRKRWRRFKMKRRALISVWIFFFFLIISFTAEFWANSKPIVMTHQGSLYFPILKYYHPSEFGLEDISVTNYRQLAKDSPGFYLWPPVNWDPIESNLAVDDFPSPPSADNWMGTDDRGRDVFARLIYGFRYSISFALTAWFFSFLLGSLIGGYMGFLGGQVDLFGQRMVEVFESMPQLLMLITLVSIFGASMELLIGFSVFFGWMSISIYMRAEFLRLRNQDFVEGARALGVSRWRQIVKHIFPNALGPLVTFSPFTIAGGVSTLAILDYLGFGLPPPTPSWGELLQQAQKNFTIAWWLAVFPSLALFITLISLNLIGEGVRDANDPRKT